MTDGYVLTEDVGNANVNMNAVPEYVGTDLSGLNQEKAYTVKTYYDKSGKITSQEESMVNGDYYKRVYTYDEYGNMVKCVITDNYGNTLCDVLTYEYYPSIPYAAYMFYRNNIITDMFYFLPTE